MTEPSTDNPTLRAVKLAMPGWAYLRDGIEDIMTVAAEAARVATLIQVCEMLTKRIVPGARIEPLRPGSKLSAADVREWLIEMIEEMR